MKTIGILGGMGPLATADLYRKIILNTAAERDQDQIHVLIDSNPEIPDRTACIIAGGEDPVPEMIRSIHRLEAQGADFLIMPCNTAHFFYDRLAKEAVMPILDMPRLTVEEILRKRGNGTAVGLLATEGTVRSGIYDRYFEETGLQLKKPVAFQSEVTRFIYDGIKKNNISIGTEGLFLAVEELREMGASLFILGCTELSAATEFYSFGPDFVDPVMVLARAAVEAAGAPLREVDLAS